jgi:hypothetical protein
MFIAIIILASYRQLLTLLLYNAPKIILRKIMNDFHHRGHVDIPAWAHCLYAPYWRIRVEGRNKALRRKSYRQIEKIKLTLVEQGYDVELINAICRYMVNFRETSAREVQQLLNEPNPQIPLIFLSV